ncbi:hypothetical protein PGB90_009745 [Kerria lacca]
MPQHKQIYGNIIFSSVLLFLLITKFVIGTPVALEENMPKKIERNRDKRSFYDIHCKGIYDQSIFAKVDQICEDCYNLFREPKLHSVCR